MRCSVHVAVLAIACLASSLGSPTPASAQDAGPSVEDRLKALEELVLKQQEEIERQRQEIEALKVGRDPPAPAPRTEPLPGPTPEPHPSPEIGPEAQTAIERRVDAYLASLEKPDDIIAGYKDGFYIGSRDGDIKLTIGGRVNLDGNFAEETSPSQNTFLIRRARIIAKGKLYEYYKFKVEVDINAGGRTNLTDGYLEAAFADELAIRFGQFKQPFSLEFEQSSRFVPFVERALPIDNFIPGRDIGFMLTSKLLGKRVRLEAAVVNGAGQNNLDVDDDVEFSGRVTLTPFAGSDELFLKGLRFGLAATYAETDLPITNTFRTAINTPFFAFNAGVAQDGDRTRWGGELAWLIGPGSIRAEMIHVRLNDVELNGNGSRSVDTIGGYVTLTYCLTGEDSSLGRIKPLENFDPFDGGWGAFEVAVRGSFIEIEDDVVQQGLGTGTDLAHDLTISLNWILNPIVLVRLNYNRVWFDDEITVGNKLRNTEDAFLMRVQIDF